MMEDQNPEIKKKRTSKQIISSDTMKILMIAAYKIFIFNHTEINPLNSNLLLIVIVKLKECCQTTQRYNKDQKYSNRISLWYA